MSRKKHGIITALGLALAITALFLLLFGLLATDEGTIIEYLLWWQKNEEIDLVAVNKELDTILFAEVKWSRKRVGTDILQALKAKAKNVHWGTNNRNEYYCLFSKSGYTEALVREAEDKGVYLFQQDQFLER